MERFICVHGHFYQPPREDPWLGYVERQQSAYPYRDWNERITAECYGPNGSAAQADPSNYARMSFNFGPTLLAWLECNAPEVYQAVLAADRQGQHLFSGHGPAIAQAYNHMVLPLANRRDRYTQVLWGIRDFQHRFGRMPEGMWLPEMAVDVEILDVLAQLGIRFTILSPYQARLVRRVGNNGSAFPADLAWRDVTGGRIDPSTAYLHRLPSGRSIALFFADGPISAGVAFGELLSSGERLARGLAAGFAAGRSWPQLVSVATCGETYGHHHRAGYAALAQALDYIKAHRLARLTNYAEYLALHPPMHEVRVFEGSSWSCAHGVERWRAGCGCLQAQQGQGWRAPLREAFDWLRDTLAPVYERQASAFLKDPWAARNDYISVFLDRSRESVEEFFLWHAVRQLTEEEKATVLGLLELQRHLMLMYTSCGWSSSDLTASETVQVIRYAGKAVQLAQDVCGKDLEARFLSLLERAASGHGDGRSLYNRYVRPFKARNGFRAASTGLRYIIQRRFLAAGERLAENGQAPAPSHGQAQPAPTGAKS